MKTKITTFLCGLLLLTGAKVLAQPGAHWSTLGNNLPQNGVLGTNTNHSLIFRTNNTERGRITNGGNWGIGTSSPGAKFHVNSGAGFNSIRAQVGGVTKFLVHSAGGVAIGGNAAPPSNGLYVAGYTGIGTAAPEQSLHVVGNEILSTGAQSGFKFRNRASATAADDWVWYSADNIARFWRAGYGDMIGITTTGNVGIGTILPENRLHVRQQIANRAIEWQHESTLDNWTVGVGTFTKNCRFEFNGVFKAQFSSIDGSLSLFSDARLKEEIEPAIAPLLGKLMQLKPAKYYYKDSRAVAKEKTLGLVAQEVEKVFPELVQTEDGGYKMLNYSGLTIVSIKAIQELQQTVLNQQQEITAIKERFAQLEAALKTGSLPGATGADLGGASLEQNHPNPAHQTTTFRYQIPAGARAQILIYEAMSGKLVKTLAAPGTGQLEMNGSDLKPGNYIYTLLVNGKAVGSRQMVLSN